MTYQAPEEKGFQTVYDVVKILTGVIVLWFALAAGMLLIRLIGEHRLRRFLVVLPARKQVSENS